MSNYFSVANTERNILVMANLGAHKQAVIDTLLVWVLWRFIKLRCDWQALGIGYS